MNYRAKRRMSDFEMSQLIHYGARITTMKDTKGNLSHEAIVMRNGMRMSEPLNLAYNIIEDFPNLITQKNPITFILRIVEIVGLTERSAGFSELTKISGIVGDIRRHGKLKRELITSS